MMVLRTAGLAGAFALGLMLWSASAPAQDATTNDAPVLADDAAPATSRLVVFLQCRVGCGPKCEAKGDARQIEHCKQVCEQKCSARDGD